MYEADDGEYDAYDSVEFHPKSKKKRIIGVLFLIYGIISFGLAQSINLNGNNRVEFGQGVFTIQACDSYIGVSLNNSDATYSGTSVKTGLPYTNESRVSGIIFSGLDTTKCAGKYIDIQIRANGIATPLDLYELGNGAGFDTFNHAIFHVNSNPNSPRTTALEIVDGYGVNQNQTMKLSGSSNTIADLNFDNNLGLYGFTYLPVTDQLDVLARMADVDAITLQTCAALTSGHC